MKLDKNVDLTKIDEVNENEDIYELISGNHLELQKA